MAFKTLNAGGVNDFLKQVIPLVHYSMAEELQSDIQSSPSFEEFFAVASFLPWVVGCVEG